MKVTVDLAVGSEDGMPLVADFELDHYLAHAPPEFTDLLSGIAERVGFEAASLEVRPLDERFRLLYLIGVLCVRRGVPQ